MGRPILKPAAAGTMDATRLAVREVAPELRGACRLHTLAFDDDARTLAAAKHLREAGFTVVDVYSPFPVHGIEAALGWRETRLPWATFAGGALGVLTGLALALYVHTVSWPLNFGGKTNSAIPAIIPVVFELGVLFAAFGTVGTLLLRRRLWPRRRSEVGQGQPIPTVTDDRFVIVVLERDARFSIDRFRATCAELAPLEVKEGWKVY